MPSGAASLGAFLKKEPAGTPGPPFALTSADNGLSVDPVTGRIVLGGAAGAAGAAVLLNNREIPTAGFTLGLSGTGKLIIGGAASISNAKLQVIGDANGVQYTIQLPAAQTIANPFIRIQDSAAAPVMDINGTAAACVFIGLGIGTVNTGARNIAIGGTTGGRSTLAANTTGVGNIAIGGRALSANTTGIINVAVGDAAMFENITGNQNIAMGQAAMAFLTSGDNNTALGYNTMHGSPTPAYSQSTAVGARAFERPTGATDCVALGFLAGSCGFVVGDHGIRNIFIGSNAVNFGNAGANNIIISAYSHTAALIGDNNISLGNAQQHTGTLSNVTLIGTSMSSSVANVAGIGRADQNVLMGITAITADNGRRLQVTGSIYADAGAGATVSVAEFLSARADEYGGATSTMIVNNTFTGNFGGGSISVFSGGIANPIDIGLNNVFFEAGTAFINQRNNADLKLLTNDTEAMRIRANGTIFFANVQNFATNALALAGGLVVGDVYRTAGALMIVI